MSLFPFPSGPLETNAYLYGCPETKKCVLIDPSPGSAKPLQLEIDRNGWQPQSILLTHSHWDHIADVKPLMEAYSIPVYIHPEDAPNLQQPGSDNLPIFFPISPIKEYTPLNEGDTLSFGTLTLEVIHTPGHSPGSVCLYDRAHHLLISGDTLFKGSIGKLTLPTGNPTAMWSSLKKLETLPRETTVHPGHGPATTLGEESWLPNAQKLFS